MKPINHDPEFLYTRSVLPSGRVRYYKVGTRYDYDMAPFGLYMYHVQPGSVSLSLIEPEDIRPVAAIAQAVVDDMAKAMMDFVATYPESTAADDVHREAIRAYKDVLRKHGRDSEMVSWSMPSYTEAAKAGAKRLVELAS